MSVHGTALCINVMTKSRGIKTERLDFPVTVRDLEKLEKRLVKGAPIVVEVIVALQGKKPK